MSQRGLGSNMTKEFPQNQAMNERFAPILGMRQDFKRIKKHQQHNTKFKTQIPKQRTTKVNFVGFDNFHGFIYLVCKSFQFSCQSFNFKTIFFLLLLLLTKFSIQFNFKCFHFFLSFWLNNKGYYYWLKHTLSHRQKYNHVFLYSQW